GPANVYAWSEAEAHALVDRHGWKLADADADEPDGSDTPDAPHGVDASANGQAASPASEDGQAALPPAPRTAAVVRELHENRELERLFVELAGLGISIDDFALLQEESVTGERLPAKYAWVTEKSGKPAALPQAGDGESDGSD